MISQSPHQPRRVAATSSSTSRSAYVDDEFGVIPYRRVFSSNHVRIKLDTSGRLRATLPQYAPVASIKKLVDSSRNELRALLEAHMQHEYSDGQRIGHSHTIRLLSNRTGNLRASISGQVISVTYPYETTVSDESVQALIRRYVAKALRKESSAYLPRRLMFLAQKGTFSYQRVRFAHQSGRWGSCSSTGTISLNIALMTLPLELIDYVLVHELAHTRQMNHSPAFWGIVAEYYPDYRAARKLLKTHNPYL